MSDGSFLILSLLVSLEWISASLSYWVAWAYVVKSAGKQKPELYSCAS